jgi:hypothetical protein
MKIRKQGSWEQWKSYRTKHNLEILAINLAVIVGVFVFAALIQFK